MAKMLIVAWVILSCLTAQAQDGWVLQHPIPPCVDFNDVHVFDDNTVIAVGRDGTIIRSEDDGATWQMPTFHSAADLQSVFFTNEAVGWIVGWDSTILKSTDSGRTWQRIKSPQRGHFNDVFFLNDTLGWVLEMEKMLKTTDGGRSWKKYRVNTVIGKQLNLQSVYLTSPDTGWTVGWDHQDRGVIYKTTDSGETWTLKKELSYNWLHSVFFSDRKTGFIVGSQGTFYKTVDGEDWQRQEMNTKDDFYGIHFINKNEGWISSDRNVYHTIDGGNTWSSIDVGFWDLYSVYFNKHGLGWIVGQNRLMLLSRDFGELWQTEEEKCSNTILHSVYFINADTGWAAGTTSLMTTNGGKDWSPITNIPKREYKKVFFIDNQTGWMLSRDTIIKTKDGGKSWTEALLRATDFMDCFFVDDKVGWVVGWNGMMKTKDGGEHWTYKDGIINKGLISVHFSNPSNGWICGYDNTILKTENAGTTWILQDSEKKDDFLGIYFLDDLLGWVVGARGTILKTNDGGDNWYLQESGTKNSLTHILFIDENIGYTVGGRGTLLKTANGGANWETEFTGTSRYLHSVYFVDQNAGWAVGDFNIILKTTTGGTTAVEYHNEFKSKSFENYSLLQNYPNPFNAKTIIPFYLADRSFVSLKIYNVLGAAINTLVQEWLATGNHRIEWNSDGLPCGIYFYQLVVTNNSSQKFSFSKKLLLLK